MPSSGDDAPATWKPGTPVTCHLPASAIRVLPILAGSSVPGVPSVTIGLTAADLGKDAGIPGHSGTRVIWLEINGPQATQALLVRLLGTISHDAIVVRCRRAAANARRPTPLF